MIQMQEANPKLGAPDFETSVVMATSLEAGLSPSEQQAVAKEIAAERQGSVDTSLCKGQEGELQRSYCSDEEERKGHKEIRQYATLMRKCQSLVRQA